MAVRLNMNHQEIKFADFELLRYIFGLVIGCLIFYLEYILYLLFEAFQRLAFFIGKFYIYYFNIYCLNQRRVHLF